MKCKDCAKYDWQTGWCKSVHDSPGEDMERDCEFYYPDINALSTRIETLEKLVAEYQDELIPGYRERADKAERERDAAVKDLNEFLGTDELCPLQCEWCAWSANCDGTKKPAWRGAQEGKT